MSEGSVNQDSGDAPFGSAESVSVNVSGNRIISCNLMLMLIDFTKYVIGQSQYTSDQSIE